MCTFRSAHDREHPAADHDLAVETTRRSAGSSTSGRLVAAMTMMPHAFKAIHLTSIWFRVCSRSSTTTQTGATLATDRIDLIDEDDAGGGFLGLFEHVTHPGGTDTHEHFHEVRT
jgi:hypothetical protein